MLLGREVCFPKSFPQAALEFDIEDLGHAVVIVRVRGEATCERAAELNERLRSSLGPGPSSAILDLAGLSSVGPGALQTLEEFGRDVRRKGGEVWLASLRPAVWLALHTARLDRLFTIRASLAQALAS
jgi:anti-anti-sigma factor